MIVFEARNAYELLVSFILGKNLISHDSQEKATILWVNQDLALDQTALDRSGICQIRIDAPRYRYTTRLVATFLRNRMLRFRRISRIFVFHEISPLSLCGLFGKPVHLLEHGEINYRDIADIYGPRHPYRLLKRLFGQSFVGEGKLFTHVYLKDPAAAPPRIRSKVCQLDLAELYDAMPQADKTALLDLFACDPAVLSPLTPVRVIATQPFSELGMMTESGKIAMYQGLINETETNVYIKPHPKETTDYARAFPGSVILDQKVPFELFWLAGLRDVEVYTVHSSIGRLPGLHVVRLGETFLNEYA
jgi:hypothetical protein